MGGRTTAQRIEKKRVTEKGGPSPRGGWKPSPVLKLRPLCGAAPPRALKSVHRSVRSRWVGGLRVGGGGMIQSSASAIDPADELLRGGMAIVPLVG